MRKADDLAASTFQTLTCPMIPLVPLNGSAQICEINFELLLQGVTACDLPLLTAGTAGTTSQSFHTGNAYFLLQL